MQMKYHAPIVAIMLGLLVGFGFIAIPAADSDAKPAKEPNQRGKGKKSKAADRPAYGFPKTAYEYAKMVEPELGVPPRVDLGKSVEILNSRALTIPISWRHYKAIFNLKPLSPHKVRGDM